MPAKKQKPKNPRFPKKTVITIILCAIALIVCSFAAYITYDRHQQRKEDAQAYAADKARFAQIEQDVELVKANLESKLQPGDTATISKSCGYTSAKFSQGDLICGVYLRVTYSDKSTDKIEDIKEAAVAIGRFDTRQPLLSVHTAANSNRESKKYYLYTTVNEHDYCTISQIDYGLAEYDLGCGHTAKKPLYNLIN